MVAQAYQPPHRLLVQTVGGKRVVLLEARLRLCQACAIADICRAVGLWYGGHRGGLARSRPRP